MSAHETRRARSRRTTRASCVLVRCNRDSNRRSNSLFSDPAWFGNVNHQGSLKPDGFHCPVASDAFTRVWVPLRRTSFTKWGLMVCSNEDNCRRVLGVPPRRLRRNVNKAVRFRDVVNGEVLLVEHGRRTKIVLIVSAFKRAKKRASSSKTRAQPRSKSTAPPFSITNLLKLTILLL